MRKAKRICVENGYGAYQIGEYLTSHRRVSGKGHVFTIVVDYKKRIFGLSVKHPDDMNKERIGLAIALRNLSRRPVPFFDTHHLLVDFLPVAIMQGLPFLRDQLNYDAYRALMSALSDFEAHCMVLDIKPDFFTPHTCTPNPSTI